MSWRQTILFIPAFIAAVVIGTLLHEGGHLLVARHLGYVTELHYQSVSYHHRASIDYRADVTSVAALAEPEAMTRSFEKPVNPQHSLLITLGGPIQTVLTGSLAFLILYRSREDRSELSLPDWVLVFLSLFWLREPVNLIAWVIRSFTTGQFKGGGDEFRIAAAAGLPEYSLLLLLAIIGLIIAILTVFKLIPSHQRKGFIMAGMVGGGLGYWLWLYELGPRLLP